jgi:DNA-binding NarL/FixJ family response regulator
MSPTAPISILLAEDHCVVREGLCALLRTDGSFTIVGEAGTGREAVDLALALRPDVVLMDIAMPELNGLAATRQILATAPTIRIVVLSAHSDDCYLESVVASGAAGFLQKQSSAAMLTRALRDVCRGKFCISPRLARRHRQLMDQRIGAAGVPTESRARLTRRETEVLQLVAEGSPNKRIASALGISIKTVEKHRQQLMDKLSIHDTAGLTRYAITTGVIESSVQLTIV